MTVDLSSCAQEPIHTPQAVQPHGALFAFDPSLRLVAFSANAEAMLGLRLALGHTPHTNGLAELAGAIGSVLRQEQGEVPDELSFAVTLDGRDYEATVHAYGDRAIVELERPSGVVVENWGPGRAYARIRAAESIEDALQRAAQGLRTLTGYDRVMAYRFHPDDSGEVVGEAKRDDLQSFLGQRYPASDIPAQARRLYALNVYRAVVDVHAEPVPVLAAPGEPLLDMSFADLRAVSPIHIEYLKNMGVASTMSLSLMVEGRLWGLLACHHGSARQLPLETRLTCEAFAHTVSARISALVATELMRRQRDAAAVRELLVRRLVAHEHPFLALDELKEDIARTMNADALVVVQGADLVHTAGIGRGDAEVLLHLAARSNAYAIEFDSAQPADDGSLRPPLAFPGVLGRCFDPRSGGWIIAARREQRATLRWGGNPNKAATLGPNGTRLTPRGSFEVWQEEVRHRSPPWLPVTRDILEQITSILAHQQLAQASQVDAVRSHVLAVLGHDLRNPLQAIKSAAGLIGRGVAPEALLGQITTSTNRMTRLITQSLDFTKLSNGLRLSGPPREIDVAALVRDIVGEFTTAYPSVVLRTSAPAVLTHALDPDRFGQVLANLLSNARHHGKPGTTLLVELRPRDGGGLRLSVRNEANPIGPGLQENLFTPFKRSSQASTTNPTGLGIGLYIVSQIVGEHQGTVAYNYAEPWVEFVVEL